ncbi:MAG TPA: 6-phosphogluconolactonase [Chitinophagaceae bacterium]|nr:6-phosphogluconolactonase [Chitinophagaceae bacterium]
MKLHIYDSPAETIKGLTEFVVTTVNEAITEKGKCSMVLSGGSSPKKLYQLLTTPAYKNKVDWGKVFFFFGDERYVPFTDKDNNGQMAKQSLLDPLGIPEERIFYFNTSLSPEEAAKDYEKKIHDFTNNRSAHFDLILLGLGDNAHTASLFPHTSVLQEKKLLVAAPYIDELGSYRLTMSAPLINNAKQIAFLVYGEKKAKAVFHVLRSPENIDEYPAQLIGSKRNSVHWFLDKEASALIE